MNSAEPAPSTFPGSRLLPSRWIELGSRAIGCLFGGSRGSHGDTAHDASPNRGERTGAVSARNSDSARKLRFWFTERNRDTL